MGLVNAMFGRLLEIGDLRTCPSVVAIKVGALDVGPNPSLFVEKLVVERSSPDCKALCQGWALWQECISTFPAHFVVLTSQCVVVTHLVSAFLLGGINPCLAVCLLHPWEEGKLGASYLPFLVMSTM